MTYSDTGQALAASTAMWALPLLDPRRPVGQLGAIALEGTQRLRSLGILALLANGDDQQFLANLSRSARLWALFLRRAKGVSPRPHHYVSGRLEPILDGIAAGDWPIVARIAAAAPAEKQGRSEYEDDYCAARLLLGLAADQPDATALEAQIKRYSDFDTPARLAAIEALAQRDEAAFGDALQQVIEDFELAQQRLLEGGAEQTPERRARSSICVEGLALLRLADRFGLSTLREYHLCPSMARTTLTSGFPDEFDSPAGARA